MVGSPERPRLRLGEENNMRRSRLLTAGACLAVLAVPLSTAVGGASAGPAPRPPAADRVLIVLFDQMVPQYPDQFNMPNYRSLRGTGTNYSKAYLGYMASETVVAHNVITSGLLPKHMGYTDEAYRDTENIFQKGTDAMHITGDFSLADFAAVQKNAGATYPKLADYLHTAHPGSTFITVGEKSYAVETATGAKGDIAVRMSGRQSNVTGDYATPTGAQDEVTAPGGCTNLGGRWRYPYGKNVPSYLERADDTDPTKCGRYFINSDKTNDNGTKAAYPSWLYPSEGNRLIPGTDQAHLGGDTWVADAAIEMMQNEDWSGMFVTMGGIDKAGHMWGAQDDTAPQDCTTAAGMTHVRCAAENADVQLGKLMDEVAQVDAQKGGRTLVVLTADHGATYGKDFYGKRTAGASDSNWYYAPSRLGVWDAGALDTSTYSSPSSAVAALDDGNLQFSYQSTAIESWLLDTSQAKKTAAASAMLSAPGVTATYWRDGNRFVLRGTNAMSTSEKAWWKAHGQEIVDTMAAPDGPDVIGLLHDRTSYGVYGDHGGAQESVQRVPMVFWMPGLAPKLTGETFRTPDLMPTVLAAMGIPLTTPADGVSHRLGG
jgi:Type I phosphodiesterase / nucleotide pyrophosphatase